MRSLIRLGLPGTKRYSLALVIAVLQGLSAIALLGTSAWLIARAAEMPPLMYLSIAIVGVRTFALARASLRYAERWLSHDSVLGSQSELRGNIYRRLIPLVPGRQKLNLGELSSRVINDVDELPNLSLRAILPLVQSLAVSLLTLVIFAVLLPVAVVPLGIALLIAYVVALPLASAISNAADAHSASARGELVSTIRATVSAAPVIASYGWQDEFLSRIATQQDAIAVANRRTARAFGLGQSIFGLMGQLSALVSAALGLQALQSQHSASLVMLAVYALLPLGLFDVAAGASNVVSVWRRYRASASRILEILDLPAASGQVHRVEIPKIDSLELKQATLGYGMAILEKIDLKLGKGRVVALTGTSGSGKTTIALALAGFVTPSSGRLLVNGKPIDLDDPAAGEALRTRVGYLEQQPSILLGSVRQNLTLAGPSAGDSELITVLQWVQLWSMFESREGLNTQLGERGVLISGGEAQRLSLARALLADFDVLLLDEPSANLSLSQATGLVNDLLAIARKAQKTVLLITHQNEISKLADEHYSIE